MICHEDIGMQSARMYPAGVIQQFKIQPVVLICIKAGLAIIATLGDMLRDTGNVQSGRAWHVMTPRSRSPDHASAEQRQVIGDGRYSQSENVSGSIISFIY